MRSSPSALCLVCVRLRRMYFKETCKATYQVSEAKSCLTSHSLHQTMGRPDHLVWRHRKAGAVKQTRGEAVWTFWKMERCKWGFEAGPGGGRRSASWSSPRALHREPVWGFPVDRGIPCSQPQSGAEQRGSGGGQRAPSYLNKVRSQAGPGITSE